MALQFRIAVPICETCKAGTDAVSRPENCDRTAGHGDISAKP
jgi:hypothetical protein